ncbi:hypothetical protein DFA_07267 [Cavenderia fasciculata]|uniref:Methyltransferase type 11 domain-containing protein n=1 Tax=Cavenderia fasciculata TaxID=261658 RepID=F4PVY3_CACFS|nr:uncharacterized protein DFA_07267 [Cavenderia fasciculata]EGG20147.1 hypothetical protein DFA_07267 [Cavenderia fasciculata]|eukprot:XP_004367130.1 hypothetical protein DFA_07267 [Cavenderia fasciculata]
MLRQCCTRIRVPSVNHNSLLSSSTQTYLQQQRSNKNYSDGGIRSMISSTNPTRYVNYTKMTVFDTQLKNQHKSNITRIQDPQSYDYLFNEVGYRLADRILDIKDVKLNKVLDFGSRNGSLLPHLNTIKQQIDQHNQFKRQQQQNNNNQVDNNNNNEDDSMEITMVDSSRDMLYRDEQLDSNYSLLVNSMEDPLPLEKGSYDLVISNLSLHWINDLPGVFSHLHQLLKPNGIILASMLGEETLTELKDALYLAEIEREGGFSAHVSPFAKLSDAGNLLSRAKFNLPTIDTEVLKIKYSNMFTLMKDLQNMGENNAVLKRRLWTSKDTFLAASSIYSALHGNKEDGTVNATFQVIYLIGWSPHQSQPKPLPRGSAKKHLSEIGTGIKLDDHVSKSSSPFTSGDNNNSNNNAGSCRKQESTAGQEEEKETKKPQLEFDPTLNEPVPVTEDFVIKRLDKHGNLHDTSAKKEDDK